MTLNIARGTHSKYLPCVFTEQGVAMLSAVLRTDKAVSISINIMKAFTLFRNIITTNATIFERVDNLEIKLLDTDKKMDLVLNAMNDHQTNIGQGIFFKGQLFDAYTFVADLIRTAGESLVLIDNYIDDSVLTLFNKRKKDIKFKIHTRKISKELQLDIKKHQEQYGKIHIYERNDFHDRFLIIDNKDIYHFGASLKDLGKKCFAFNKLDKGLSTLLLEYISQ